MPPDLREWVPAGHPVLWVVDVVKELDTSELHRARKTGGVGRQGYDPVMMLTLLIWAWSQGQRSSRQIERLCAQDVVYRYICAGNLPDHTSIARFRAGMGDAVQDLFAQVLVLCAELGMVRLGVVALDGTKIAADASIGANRTEKGLLSALEAQMAKQAATAAAEHEQTDQNEDALFGVDRQPDTVPDDPGTPSGRHKRLREALDKVRAEQKARDEQRERKSKRSLRGQQTDRASAEQVAKAQARYDKAVADQQAKIDRWDQASQDGRPRGFRPWPAERCGRVQQAAATRDRVVARASLPERTTNRQGQPVKPPVCNTTDPESGMQPLRGGGYLQGYNGQYLTSQDGVIIGVGLSANPTDSPTFVEMITIGTSAAQMLSAHRPDMCNAQEPGIGLVLADAGYLSKQNLTCPGPDRLIAVGKRRQLEHDARRDPATGPPPDDAGPVAKMAHRLRTPEGIAAYRQRSHIAETPFGDSKHNKQFRRMTGRGLRRARADWAFNALVHNLGKALRHALAT